MFGLAPHIRNILTRHSPRGVRSFKPARSSGVKIGPTLLVMWRKPFSHTASSSNPSRLASGARSGQIISRSMRPMCSRSSTRYGMSKRPKAAIRDDMIDDGSARSAVPSLSFCSRTSSPPS